MNIIYTNTSSQASNTGAPTRHVVRAAASGAAKVHLSLHPCPRVVLMDLRTQIMTRLALGYSVVHPAACLTGLLALQGIPRPLPPALQSFSRRDDAPARLRLPTRTHARASGLRVVMRPMLAQCVGVGLLIVDRSWTSSYSSPTRHHSASAPFHTRSPCRAPSP